MQIYIGDDTETGGLSSAQHSLLTAYFGFYVLESENPTKYKLIDELDLAVKDPTGKYRVTPQAMAVNKINLIEHDKVAIPVMDAAKLLYDKVMLHTEGGKHKMINIGQNIPFDEGFIFANLMPRSIWENFVMKDPKEKLDTKVILKKAKDQGKIPKDQSISLGAIAKFLEIDIAEGELHGAKYDTQLCVKVLEKAQDKYGK